MNIVLLANRDLASCLAINRLLPDLLTHHRVHLILSARVGGRSRLPPALESLRFAEQTLFNDILFPLADSLPTAQRGSLRTFNALAAETGNPLLVCNRLNVQPELDRFRALEPDLAISIRYGVILQQQTLAVPRLGVLNLHSGRLPDYRGVMASFWALLNGESSLGTTLHTIDDEGIDTGSVVAMSALPVDRQKSYLWHVLALYEAGCANIRAAVERLSSGESLSVRAQPEAGSYYSFPDADAIERFHHQGWRLVADEDLIDAVNRFLPVAASA